MDITLKGRTIEAQGGLFLSPDFDSRLPFLFTADARVDAEGLGVALFHAYVRKDVVTHIDMRGAACDP